MLVKNELWLYPDLNLDTVLQDQDLDKLIEYVDENQQHIATQWIQNELSQLRKTLRLGTTLLSCQEQKIKKEKLQYMIFKLGALFGTLESFNYLMYENDNQQQTVEAFKKDIKCIKHLQEVVLLLDLYGDLTHSEISEKLSLNPPTLTEIMKKIIPTDLIRVTTAGKYKLYSLTEIGRRLAVHLRGVKSESDQLDSIFSQLKEYTQQTNEIERIRKHIAALMEQLDGAPLFPGDALSLDYQDERKNFNHLEVAIQGVNTNSLSHVSVQGNLKQRVSVSLPLDELLKEERRNENGQGRTTVSLVRDLVG